MTALSVPGFQRPDDCFGSTLVHGYRQQLSVSKDSPEAGALVLLNRQHQATPPFRDDGVS